MVTTARSETTTAGADATATAPNGRGEGPLDTSIRLVTPERIAFEYPLAGPFRRSLAYLLDIFIQLTLVFLLSIGVGLVFQGGSSGVLLVLVFAMMWGYGAVFEGIFNGQTPGKMALGIRVVSDQGVPITGAQAFLRNLLWSFDGLVFGYIPALACMVLTRRFQRLGDLAAGTMVMVERRPSRGALARVSGEPAVAALLPWLPSRVEAGPELSRALADYVKHRARLPVALREEMAAHVAGPIRRRYNLPGEATPDAVVCALYHRVFLGE